MVEPNKKELCIFAAPDRISTRPVRSTFLTDALWDLEGLLKDLKFIERVIGEFSNGFSLGKL